MFNPETAMMDHCIFVYSIPEGIREWCEERQIQGRIFERFDGGGPTGYVVEFEDEATKNLVAAAFLDDPKRQFLMGEAIRYRERLWDEEAQLPAK